MYLNKKNKILLLFLVMSAALIISGCQKSGTPLSAQEKATGSESKLVFDEAAYPPNGWTISMADAAMKAADEDKMILINFIGSDWCVWCQKLEQEVFSTQLFLDWANDNLVMVFLDFPQSVEQSDTVIQQNQMMQQAMGVQGFPTIMLLDSDLTPLMQTGYREGGAASYIAHLENDHMSMTEESAENFRIGFGEMIEEALIPLNIN